VYFDQVDTHHINCQEIGLQQLLINLIGNSVEELTDKINGKITILVEKGVYYTDITIQDNGNGMPPHLVSKINTGLTTTKKDGTGLGLLLCKKILANNNGELIYKRIKNETLFVCRFYNKDM
jgi:C4-dicarboxylate-specific signal transduction histidine kinase